MSAPISVLEHEDFVLAVRSRDWELVKRLVQQKPELLDMTMTQGGPNFHDRPIHYILRMNQYKRDMNDIVLFVLRTRPSVAQIRGHRDELPLHVAARNNLIATEVVQKLVELYPKALCVTDGYGRTALHFALEGRWLAVGSFEVVSFLLKKYPEAARQRDHHGLLPLDLAVKGHKVKETELLLQTYPESANLKNKDGHCPLRCALFDYLNTSVPGATEIFDLLIQATDLQVLQSTENGCTLIHVAARKFRSSLSSYMLLTLINLFPEAVEMSDKDGNLPIHVAAMQIDDYCVEEEQEDSVASLAALIDAYPEGLEIPNKDGMLPLHLLTKTIKDNWTTGEMPALIDRFPDALKVPGQGGKLPLHIAVERGDPLGPLGSIGGEDWVRRILEDTRNPYVCLAKYVADQYPEGLIVEDWSGNLPLDYAITGFNLNQGTLAVQSHILSHLIKVCPESLDHVNSRTGQSPLHLAAEVFKSCTHSKAMTFREGFHDVALTTLVHGNPAALFKQDHHGMTPVHILLESSHEIWGKEVQVELIWKKVICLFVEHCPQGSLDLADKNGRLPLHSAAANKAPLWLINLLLEKSPSALNARDESGSLPLLLATTADSPLDSVYTLVRCNPSRIVSYPDDPFGVAKVMDILAKRETVADRVRKRKRNRTVTCP